MNAFEKFSMMSEAVDQQLNEAVVREVAEDLGVTVEDFNIGINYMLEAGVFSKHLGGGIKKGVADNARTRVAGLVKGLKKDKPKAYKAFRGSVYKAIKKGKDVAGKATQRMKDAAETHSTVKARLARAAKKAAANK